MGMVQSKLPDGTWLKYDSNNPPPAILQLRAAAKGGGGPPAPGPSAPGPGGGGGGAVVQPNVDPSMANTAPPPLDRSGAPPAGAGASDGSWMSQEAMGPALEGSTAGWLSEISGLIGGLIGMARGEEFKAARNRTEAASDERLAEYRKQHPVASTALELGGAAATAAAIPEIKAAEYLGVPAASTAARVINPAATGATFGAAYGGGKGHGATLAERAPDIARGAVEGMAGGVAGEMAGQGIAAGARKLAAPYLAGSDRAAAGAVVGAIDRDLPNMSHAEQLQFMRDRRAEGHDFRVGDIATARNVGEGTTHDLAGAFTRGENVGGATTQDLARRSANLSGAARNQLEDVTSRRFAAEGPAFEAAIERHTGGMGQETGRGLDDRLAEASRTARKPFYDRAYTAGDAGIQMSPAIGELMGQPDFQAFMREGRDALARSNAAARATGGQEWPHMGTGGGPGVRDPSRARATLAYWDQVKRQIDDAWNRARRAGNNNEARILDQYRTVLRNELIRQVPEYRDALGVAETLFGARDAGELGTKMAASNADAVDLRRAQARMTPEDQAFFRANWVSHYVGKLRDVSDARSIVTNFARAPEARAQLEAVLGRDAAEKLFAHLQVNKMMDRLRGAVSGNSTTARQFAQLALPEIIAGSGAGIGSIFAATHPSLLNIGLAAGSAAAGGASRLARKGLVNAKERIRETGAQKIAELLMSDDPARYEAAISMIAHSPAILRILERFNSRAPMGAGVAGAEQAFGGDKQ